MATPFMIPSTPADKQVISGVLKLGEAAFFGQQFPTKYDSTHRPNQAVIGEKRALCVHKLVAELPMFSQLGRRRPLTRWEVHNREGLGGLATSRGLQEMRFDAWLTKKCATC
jgi:hypothetical protein